MKALLVKTRSPEYAGSIKTMIFKTIIIMVIGFALGVIQKWLDELPNNLLPSLFQQLDVVNYFGRLSIWILLSTVISVCSKTPLRAAINTFLFLISMISGYYIYCNYVLGFLPRTYMMIWIVISILSFFLAYICWYAKGRGRIAILVSSVILGVLFSQAVIITKGIYITNILDFATWIIGVIVLYRKPKEYAIEIGLSLCIAFLYQLVIPFYG